MAVTGALTLIETKTANFDSELIFSSDISSYQYIVFIISNLTTSSLGDIPYILTSSNAGQTFDTSGYFSGIIANKYDNTKLANLNTTTSILIGDNLDSPGAVNAYLFCSNVNQASNFSCQGNINYMSEGYFIMGQMNAQGPSNVNAFKFSMRDGTMVSGTISQYAIVS